jgi:hypothetical protein
MSDFGILSPDAITENSYTQCKDKTQFQSKISSTVLNTEISSQAEPSLRVDRRLFCHTGLLSAKAIDLHNFPEGMATFCGAIQDPQVGFALALGVVIRNIPGMYRNDAYTLRSLTSSNCSIEGIAIDGPIYIPSGSISRGLL